MSFVKLPDGAFDTFSVIARPTRVYMSSSAGITGSVKIYQRSSDIEKVETAFSDKFSDESVDTKLGEFREDVNYQSAETYMNAVNSSRVSGKHTKSVGIIRFEPSFGFTSDTLRKSIVRNVLYPFYASSYPGLNWGFTNYLSLHFPDGIGPTSASLVYPSPSSSNYVPSGAFTFETYIKPSYTGQTYHAGTVLHASSSFALSIVSGSGRDQNGNVSTFRMMLQLSHSADIPPSDVDLSVSNNVRSYPSDLVFLSDDVIKFNHWTHVAARWGPNNNGGTGSFYIDGVKSGEFYIPSGSATSGSNSPEAVFVGNFYEAPFVSTSPQNMPQGFFNYDAFVNEGVTDDYGADPGGLPEEPTQFTLRHPLRGEIHETKIWKRFLAVSEILTSSLNGTSPDSDLLFYLPPFFTKESRSRWVLQTPFQHVTSTTDDPMNVAMSFGVGGHLVNLENHVREMVKGKYPRLLFLTASEFTGTSTSNDPANEYIYNNGEMRRRNLTILPCDNGKMSPNFMFLLSGSDYGVSGTITDKFVTDIGSFDPSFVNMSNLIPSSSLFPGLVQDSDLLDELMGASPENPGVAPGAVLTIFQRTRDGSSNCVTFFDSSNMMYGGRIHPGSYTVVDNNITGSDGTLAIRLRDNGRGILYRADASSSHSVKSVVGSCLYAEGIAAVTSPYLGEIFGKDTYTVEMRGEQSMPVQEIQAIAPAWTLTSSSNPTFKSLISSDYANDKNTGFVYINTVNFHDENLNVIARANFAQPLVKRPNDRMMIRVKFDY